MDDLTLTAQPRELTGKKVKHLRAEGLVPAVLYGREIETQSLMIPRRQLEELLSKAGSTQLIKIEIEGREDSGNVLVRDVQRDILSSELLHADFYQVVMGETITAEIPVVLVGDAPAVQNMLGVLVQGLDTLPVECLPGDLISQITVDLSVLEELRDTISVGDLDISEDINVLVEPDEMIATITTMRTEEEVEAIEEPEVVTSVVPELVTEEGEEEMMAAEEEEMPEEAEEEEPEEE
jgi:large subunit ribosomal protein L25